MFVPIRVVLIVCFLTTVSSKNDIQNYFRRISEFIGPNGTLVRDYSAEKLIRQIFEDNLKPKILNGHPVLGSVLDPLWLWPQDPIPIKKKGLFEGFIEACDLHLHNMKKVKLVDIEVHRDVSMGIYGVKAVFHVPIVWMTGRYRLTKSKILGFIPAKGKGDFNVDLINVYIGVGAILRADNQTTNVTLDTFEMMAKWSDSGYKFDGLQKGLNHMTDWTLNQLGFGNLIAISQRSFIISEARNYFCGLFECLIYHPAEDHQICMRQFWIGKGHSWPWVLPPTF